VGVKRWDIAGSRGLEGGNKSSNQEARKVVVKGSKNNKSNGGEKGPKNASYATRQRVQEGNGEVRISNGGKEKGNFKGSKNTSTNGLHMPVQARHGKERVASG